MAGQIRPHPYDPLSKYGEEIRSFRTLLSSWETEESGVDPCGSLYSKFARGIDVSCRLWHVHVSMA